MKKKVFLMIIALAGFFSGCNQTEKKLPERVSLVHSKYDMGGMMLVKAAL
jgi:predicted component of type VI protein secretion system